MIELPEAEVLRRDLEREVAGKKVKSIDIHAPKPVGGTSGKARLTEALDGAKLIGAGRKAHYLLLHTDRAQTVVLDLSTAGELRRAVPKDEVHKKSVWVITFSQGGQLRLVDTAGTSVTAVGGTDTLTEDVPMLATLGIDPVEQAMSWIAFARSLLQHHGRLRPLVMNPSVVAGIGPVYADEILFEAGLRFDRDISTLNEQELRRLYRATVEVLHDAIKHRGTTLPSRPFVDLAGKPGGYAELLQVHGREGQLSPRSRRPIAKTVYEGQVTYYCEQSQV